VDFVLFQICQFIDEILDSVYSRADLLIDDHSAVPLPCDNTSRDCDTSVNSSVSAHGTAGSRSSSRLILQDTTDLLSVNDGDESEMHVPSHPAACNNSHSDTVVTQHQSQVHSLLSNLPVSDLVSRLYIHLAPLSDFLTQHLALLQTWLSCASYGRLVDLLCHHIAQVNCIEQLFS